MEKKTGLTVSDVGDEGVQPPQSDGHCSKSAEENVESEKKERKNWNKTESILNNQIK